MRKYSYLICAFLLLFFGTAIAQITLWTTENQPSRMAIQENIAATCEAETGVSTTLVPVEEELLGERVTAAYAAGELPDVIFHPPYYTLTWADAGILDVAAASELVNDLGRETFNQSALDYVEYEGEVAAVPVSGFPVLVLYRQDLFEEAGLEPPTNFEAIREAVEALHNPSEGIYGVAVGTDPSNVIMQQHLEALFLANGVDLFDESGNIDVNNEETIEVLNFYKFLAEHSPPGNLDSTAIQTQYLAGNLGMTFWASYILDEAGGLRNDLPITAFTNAGPDTRELAQNTGILANYSGPSGSGPTSWGEFYYFGITADADTEAATQFVNCVMNEGYMDWLSMAPEGSLPARGGTAEDPNQYFEAWADLEVGVDRKASLSELYSEEAIQNLTESFENNERWAFAEGKGVLVSRILSSRVLTETVREFLAGEHTAEETAELLQQRIEDLE